MTVCRVVLRARAPLGRGAASLDSAPMSSRPRRLSAFAQPGLTSSPPAPDDEERERDEGDEGDDAQLDLPPLDTDDEPAAEEGEGDELSGLLDPVLDEGDPLDDAVARDLDVALELDVDDEPDARADDAEGEIDVGPLDEGLSLDEEGGGLDEEGEEAGDQGDDILDADSGGEDDGGAEGTGESPEDAVDESELPALDADEEGEYAGEDLLGELSELPDDTPPPWDASPWVVIEGAGAAVPCSALAAAGGQIVAGGSVLLVVPPGERAARRPGLDAVVGSVALVDGAIVAATPRGRVLRSEDGGATAAPLGAWRSDGLSPVALATTPGRLWILAEGTLWSLPAGAGSASRASEGDVVRIAASGGALLSLSQAPGVARLTRVRGDDEGTAEIPLSGAALRAASARGAVIAVGAQGRSVALAGADLLCVSRDGGASFRVLGGLGPVAALAFAGEDEAAPLLALCVREGDARAELARVPDAGAPTRIAALGERRAGDDDDVRGLAPAAMIWDAAREVAWIACQVGLLAVAPKPEH